MENILTHQQFPESYIAMAAELNFEVQNYVTTLLISEESSLLTFDFPKREEAPEQNVPVFWDELETVEF